MPPIRAARRPSFRTARLLPSLALVMLLAACAQQPPESAPPDAAAATDPPAAWADARQLVLVTAAGWDDADATLRRYERDQGGDWRNVGEPVAVTLGRSGSAWGLGLHPAGAEGPQKREGDGRAPAGVFAIGTAFGYADSAQTLLPYQAMTVDDYCIDVAASPLYNRIVDAGMVGREAVRGSSETMRLDLHNDGDPRYRLGFVIGHNPDAIPGQGSCIFAHLRRQAGEATAGCTAMDEPQMQALLAWLDPRAAPVFALMPTPALDALAAAWDLPH